MVTFVVPIFLRDSIQLIMLGKEGAAVRRLPFFVLPQIKK